MRVYYNEFDPAAAQWLRNLIRDGLIPDGDVDERSIVNVQGDDLQGYDQVHFFAGIAGWPLALQIAAWPDKPVWTGSCPCQPFSAAGKGKGTKDERHLWPEMFRLIRECRPDVIFGEQVERAVKHGWLDGVFTDLEGEDYACGATVLGAHSVKSPNIRQRLFWVADSEGGRRNPAADGENASKWSAGAAGVVRPAVGLGDSNSWCGAQGDRQVEAGNGKADTWASASIISCGDGKSRRIESGSFPLAHGIPRKLGPGFAGLDGVGVRAARANRVTRLRGYGNAINPWVAAEFIKAYMEV